MRTSRKVAFGEEGVRERRNRGARELVVQEIIRRTVGKLRHQRMCCDTDETNAKRPAMMP